MKFLIFLYPALAALATLVSESSAATKPKNSILLRDVKALTLRSGQKTSHRRVSAIPQLKCIGGNAKGLYDVDVMRCLNQGTDYDDDNVQWTCKASLPLEFKLGSTQVMCEGYSSPDDPYILKGSCGVEYRLLLTSEGEAKYGRGGRDPVFHRQSPWIKYGFWLIFAAVTVVILVSAFNALSRGGRNLPGFGQGGGWGGGGGGGGGGDPPPPYDWQPPRKPTTSSSRSWMNPGLRGYGSFGRAGNSGQQGWRPGFWTGAATGAAAGYFAGNRGNTQDSRTQQNDGLWNDRGEGSSRRSSSNTSPSSSRYEGTGFGSTTRR